MPQEKADDRYKFRLTTEQGNWLSDPYAREATGSVDDAVAHDPDFDREGGTFQLAPWNVLVVCELHVGTSTTRGITTRPSSIWSRHAWGM